MEQGKVSGLGFPGFEDEEDKFLNRCRKAKVELKMSAVMADGGMAFSQYFNIDGTPCAVKAACTVWAGGKDGDGIKILPIGIVYGIAITAMVRRVPGPEPRAAEYVSAELAA